jgi:hypothetical protein
MQLSCRLTAALGLAFSVTATCLAHGPKYTDPAQTDADFAIQGEYVGTLQTSEGSRRVGVQVVALGDGKFLAVGYAGGLPGDGWDGKPPERVESQSVDGLVSFTGKYGRGTIREGRMQVVALEGGDVGTLARIVRQSPTLGEKPPAGAVILFDGTGVDAWKDGRMTEDGLLREGTTSQREFGSHRLHLEFRLPYQPHDRDQARGNSGIYVQGRYELQMLDSFGLEGKDNECGGIYTVKAPDVNMCYPPLSWQTYDIDFTAAKYDESGKLRENPRISARHNGVVVHDDVELPGNQSTRAAPQQAGPQPGPVYLQNHGCPVRYRNIWVVEKP